MICICHEEKKEKEPDVNELPNDILDLLGIAGAVKSMTGNPGEKAGVIVVPKPIKHLVS